MKRTRLILLLSSLAVAAGQSIQQAEVTNLDSAKWSHENGAPADTEAVVLHEDQKTGATDLLVRYPSGHVIAPHFHDSNERIVVVEGQVTLREDSSDRVLNAGGFAFLPALKVQRMSCTSKTRCTFYLFWDGKPNSHPAK